MNVPSSFLIITLKPINMLHNRVIYADKSFKPSFMHQGYWLLILEAEASS